MNVNECQCMKIVQLHQYRFQFDFYYSMVQYGKFEYQRL